MNKTRLKKCPFCHNSIHVIVDWNGGRTNGKFKQIAYCSNCGYHAEPKETYEEAVKTWNMQVSNGNQISLF